MTTAAAIQRATAAEFKLSLAELLGSSRQREFAVPRQLAMALCRDLTWLSHGQVGLAFHRDHTSVVHAYKRTAERIASDADLLAARDRIIMRLAGI